VGYSPSEDVIVVKLADDGNDFFAGDVLTLPAAKYADLLKRKPIGISREAYIGNKSTKGAFDEL
jgi:hypothetical protein